MSRRLRVEIQKAEKAEEEEKVKHRWERIWAPLVWKRLTSGIRIEDLKPKYFQEALNMIEEYYVVEEVLCRNACLKDDKESLESYLNLVHYYLKDSTSLVAIKEIINDEGDEDDVSEEIVGVLIMKVMRKLDYDRAFNRNLIVDGEALKTCLQLINYLDRKSDIYEELNCLQFLQYLQLCIKPEYRQQGLDYHLMLCAVDEARTLNCPVIMGIFSNYRLQRFAKRIGMQINLEIYYRDWKDKLGDLIFEDPGTGNYSCAVMACRLIPLPSAPSEQSRKENEESEEESEESGEENEESTKENDEISEN